MADLTPENRLLKKSMIADGEGDTKTTRPNEMWQTDFTSFKIIGWGWMYLSSVLDNFSRYIIACKLCTNMRAEDVTDTLDLALAASGCDSATVRYKLRLLSDNGPSYIAGKLAEYIEVNKMSHVRGARAIPRHRARSSAGTRPSKTASCWKMTSCPATSKSRFRPSSSTITTSVTTRAWPT